MSDRMVLGRLPEGGGISAGGECLRGGDEAAGGSHWSRYAWSPRACEPTCSGRSLGLAGLMGRQGVVPSGKTLRQALPPWEWLLEARAWGVWLFRFGFCFGLVFFFLS